MQPVIGIRVWRSGYSLQDRLLGGHCSKTVGESDVAVSPKFSLINTAINAEVLLGKRLKEQIETPAGLPGRNADCI